VTYVVDYQPASHLVLPETAGNDLLWPRRLEALLYLVVGGFVYLFVELITAGILFLKVGGWARLRLCVFGVAAFVDEAFNPGCRLSELFRVEVRIILYGIVGQAKLVVGSFEYIAEIDSFASGVQLRNRAFSADPH